jgi:hypothetical protein
MRAVIVFILLSRTESTEPDVSKNDTHRAIDPTDSIHQQLKHIPTTANLII